MKTPVNTHDENNDLSFASGDYEAAYRKVLPDLEALDRSRLVPIRLKLSRVVTKALGVVHTFETNRARLLDGEPDVNVTCVSLLGDRARAAAYANSQHLIRPPSDLTELHAEATTLRATLRADARTLAGRGLLPREALRLDRTSGYREVATDIRTLVDLFGAHWTSIAGKCATSEAELQRALHLASRVMETVGIRDHVGTRVVTADLRQRAYTLLVNTYDQVRRAVVYLRWEHGDADLIAPSLYADRRRKRRDSAPHSDGTPLPALTAADTAEETAGTLLNGNG